MSQGSHPADPRRWRALALLGTAFFMVILDGTIVVTALPVIGHELGLSTGGLQWVISAYLICFGGFLLLGGRSADLLGRRRLFMAGVGLFIGSSLACGLAPGAGVLIAARVVQGISAAVMAPTALSLLMTVFPEGPERNTALGIWGGIGGIGATAGLLIGGPITDALGWEWIFFINVPVGLALLALTPRLLPESVDPGLAAPIRSARLSGASTGSVGSAATQQGHGRLACELLTADATPPAHPQHLGGPTTHQPATTTQSEADGRTRNRRPLHYE